METPVIVRHGAVLRQLPPGFRFHPTDEELVLQYLRRKVLSMPLPAAVIPEIDHLGKHDPWELPGAKEGERYFFTLQEASCMEGSRSKRATASGHWKATGREKPIHFSRSKLLVGMKRVLVFHLGSKPQNAARTEWIMHEYRLAVNTQNIQHKNPTLQNGMNMELKNWVVCRMFRKNRSQRSDEEEMRPYYYINNQQMQTNQGFAVQHDVQEQNALQPSESSSSASCVTDTVDQEVNSDDNAISEREA